MSPSGRKGLILRLAVSLLFVGLVYWAADHWTLRSWNPQDSLVVRLLKAGPETPRGATPEGGSPASGVEGQEETFPTLDRLLRVLVLTGEQRGRVFDIVVSRLAGSGVDLLPDRRYLLVEDVFEDGGKQYSIADAYRIPSVAAFVALVASLLLAFTGWAGFRALLGLSLSIVCLLWGMIPLMASGWAPIPLSFSAVLVISTLTILCVVKRPRYRAVALLGSLGGVGCGFLLGAAMVFVWQLNGLSGEGAALLASTLPEIDIRGILLASLLIGAIGAVLDVGISITASMAELVDYDPDIPLRRLWEAGTSVGGEVLGSMINTLILAYLGSTLPMAVLISSAGADVIGLLNDPYIGQEIVQSLAGTAGLLLTIPMTALFFVVQEGWQRRRLRAEVKGTLPRRDEADEGA